MPGSADRTIQVEGVFGVGQTARSRDAVRRCEDPAGDGRRLGRADYHASEPPDAATIREWETETRRQLRERYGDRDGDRRLAVARAFVKSRPGFQQMLNDSGVGSHPRLITMLAENVNTLRMVPRTTQPKARPAPEGIRWKP